MLFKGVDYVKVKNIVSLPVRNKDGKLMPYVNNGENYIYFGKVSKLGQKKSGAVKSEYNLVQSNGEKEPIYAVPLEITGHSLTNRAYCADGYVYLMLDGSFYRSKKKLNLVQGKK